MKCCCGGRGEEEGEGANEAFVEGKVITKSETK